MLGTFDAISAFQADIDQKSGRKRFENDLKRLRDWGVDLDHREGEYCLISYGEFSPVALGEAELDALAFLGETFAPGAPRSEAVQALVRAVADWLPENQHDSIAMRRQRLRMDLRRRDEDVIDPAVQATIERAISQHRLLRFNYLSPSQADGLARTHTVQPWQLFYDTTRHHLYLEAYRLQVAGPTGVWKKEQWQPYRLGRIAPEGLTVLPDKFPVTPPKRPCYALEYLLAPEIARTGEISRHFAEMEIHETDAAGWVRVTATTHDLFAALRLLLHYGANCRVIGGSEARRAMQEEVQRLAELYGGTTENGAAG